MTHHNFNLDKIPVLKYYNGFADELKNAKDFKYQLKNAIAFDTETTGLNFEDDEIIQIAFTSSAVFNNTQFLELAREISNLKRETYSAFFKPKNKNLEDVLNASTFNQQPSQSALIKNAFNSEKDEKILALALFKVFEKRILITQNGINFDLNFVQKLFRKYNLHPKFAVVDMLPLIYRLELTPKLNGKISFSQASIGKLFHVENIAPHNAIGDTLQLYQIWENVIKRFGWEKIINLANKYQGKAITTDASTEKAKNLTL